VFKALKDQLVLLERQDPPVLRDQVVLQDPLDLRD
jgi:hypothetical protein